MIREAGIKRIMMRQVLLDVDGTLVDSRAVMHDTLMTVCKRFGYMMPGVEALRAMVGLPLAEALSIIYSRPVDDEIHAMVQEYHSLYPIFDRDRGSEYRIYDGIAEMIEGLGAREDLVLGLVTGRSRSGMKKFLAGFPFARHFTVNRCSDDCPSKPYPTMVLECCRESGISPARTLIVGDTTFELDMAKAAGADAIGVSWGYHTHDQLTGVGAFGVVDSVAELSAAIDHWLENCAELAHSAATIGSVAAPKAAEDASGFDLAPAFFQTQHA